MVREASIKLWRVLAVALLMIIIVFSFFAFARETTPKPIIVLGGNDFPPYESLVDGQPVGMNVDLWQEIAKILERPLDYRLYQWADSQARVARGEGQILSFMSFSKEREKRYDFTRPTFSFKFPIFAKANSIDNFDLSNMNGKRIAVKRGSFPRVILETLHPRAEIVFIDSPLDGFHKLLRNEIDAVVEEEIVGYTILRQNDIQGIRATAENLATKTGHVAVIKGNPQLVFQINRAIRALEENGKFDQIADKWSGAQTVLISRQNAWLVFDGVLVVLGLVIASGGIFYVMRVRKINIALNKEIEERKLAEKSNIAKSAFLANMSHDLRTPLNAIIGFSEMMMTKIYGPLGDPHYDEYAKDIRSGGHLLISLIDDILDISKIEAGKYDLNEKAMDVSALIRNSVKMVCTLDKAKKLHITTDMAIDLPPLQGDGRAITQILNNLISNAIKFTPDGGNVKISATTARDGSLIISVADTGQGMPESDINKALKPFEQVDSTHSRRHEGTGLGLYLCQHLMKLHAGELKIQSDVGAGTTVTLCFPKERTLLQFTAMPENQKDKAPLTSQKYV